MLKKAFIPPRNAKTGMYKMFQILGNDRECEKTVLI